jgi:hypothetical protein
MTYPNTCGFCPCGLSFAPSHLIEDTLVNKCRGFVRNLAVIDVEADCYLLSLDHFIGHAPIVWIDLVPLLCETLHKLLIVQ